MSMILNVEILGEFRKLTQATEGAAKDLQGLNGKIGGFSSSAKKLLGGLAAGFSFSALVNGLETVTKAAIEDRKSQELLAVALRNTVGANDTVIASVEKSISAWQYQTAVADDELRPAYQKLVMATGDVEKANGLMAIALDTSAGSGKGLDQVAQAMAKSIAGSDTALIKLLPSVKDSKTPIEDLAKAFAGAAEASANQDPYQRFQIVLGELQEQIGTQLLPVLDDFSAWLTSEEGQAGLAAFNAGIKQMGDYFGDMYTDTKEVIGILDQGLKNIGLSDGMGDVLTWLERVQAIMSNINVWGLLKNVVLALGGKWKPADLLGQSNVNAINSLFPAPNQNAGRPMTGGVNRGGVTVNINQGTMTGSDIQRLIDKYGQSVGVPQR
jgi:hypothetical protein